MMRQLTLCGLLIGLVLFNACEKKTTEEPKPGRPPVADAGDDFTAPISADIVLDGSGSYDPDTNQLTYQWTVKSSPSGSNPTLSDATKVKAKLVADATGDYTIQLAVSDGVHPEVTDDVVVTVTDVEALLIDQRIESDLVIKDLFSDPNTPDCIVDGDIYVSAALTVEPGVVIQFQPESGFATKETGSLSAVGNATKPIVFKGTSASPGSWSSILFDSNNPANKLEYVTLEYGGFQEYYLGNQEAMVIVGDAARADIKHCTFLNSQNYGLYLYDEAVSVMLEDNQFLGNEGPAAYLHASQMAWMDKASDYAGEGNANGKQFLQVAASNVEKSATWPALNVPFRIAGTAKTTDASVVVTVEAGARIQFEGDDAGIWVDKGALKAVGTAAAPIVFTGAVESPGAWSALYFSTSNANNELSYVTVAYGGSGYYYTGNRESSVTVDKDARLTITNSTIGYSKNYGLYVFEEGELEAFGNNTFEGNEGAPLYLNSNSLGMLDAASDYSGDSAPNGLQFVEADNREDIDKSATWQKLDVPFRMVGTHKINATDVVIEVRPGAILSFADENSGIWVEKGAFKAIGTAQEKIQFVGVSPAKGAWSALYFDTNNTHNELQHIVAEYGGSGYYYTGNKESIITVSGNGRLKLTNSTIRNSRNYGVYVYSGGTLTESGNAFSGNAVNVESK
ncbi:REJ domain-containing protein [Catalinimonas alkaloidigena]|uniref:REJ domain-containing protein n=1 Tax=Catalinimonas alkaloidigena TaxID=1075417 RepID=A0A1G9DLH5_9BACT|nr:right-handed parallel beta-helix repeat-containing protein [Catalinimonas alkaloidigena]SDK64729.1 REJ domain-containing protein [Catalinimonas alkaloidigena]